MRTRTGPAASASWALCCGGDGIGRANERDEERVALRVHLDAAVAGKMRPRSDTPVLCEHVGVRR